MELEVWHGGGATSPASEVHTYEVMKLHAFREPDAVGWNASRASRVKPQTPAAPAAASTEEPELPNPAHTVFPCVLVPQPLNWDRDAGVWTAYK